MQGRHLHAALIVQPDCIHLNDEPIVIDEKSTVYTAV